MKCLDFREIIDSYLCDELLTETNHEILRHLEECADCRGVIENRRILRSKIKSAVKNSPQFQMRDEFFNRLRVQLKREAITVKAEKKSLWTRNTTWLAFAASLIFAVGLGFWFLPQPESSFSADVALSNQEAQKISLADYAAGDHQNCAVKYNLAEEPVDIDLASARYADLRQGILNPLQSSDSKYELLESHTCKYAGREFTHIVFRHQNKTVSVLLTNLQNHSPLKDDEIADFFSDGYQIARFDVKDKAVFVVSDLSEQENTATAKILEKPLKANLSAIEHADSDSSNEANYRALKAAFVSP